jgi:AcrR family transcriptional regulator
MDPRVEITEESIRTAFFQLVEEVGFRKINIRSLTTRAGVNRTTFYLHYVDKYELLNQIEDDMLAGIERILTDALSDDIKISMIGKTIFSAAVRIFRYVEGQEYEFRILFSSNGDPGFFHEKYKTLIERVFDEKAFPLPGFLLPRPYLIAVITGIHTNFVREWIMNGAKETPEQLATMISRLAKGALKEFW